MFQKIIPMVILLIISKNYYSQNINFDDILEGQNVNFTKSIISTLTSPQFEGRDIERETISRSIVYLESMMRAYNIKTYFDNYRIPFKIDANQTGYNIVGLYRGNLRKRSAILITANYDNLGMAKNRTTKDSFFKGGNDNATGVSAVFQLALFFNKIKPKENIIFALTSGKHKNMMGAGFLADTLSKHDYLDIKYVINLEMLGRPFLEGRNNLLCVQDTTNTLMKQLNSYIHPEFIQLAQGDVFTESFEHEPFYNVLKVPSITLTSFNFENDKYYLTVKDDLDNLYLDYLHRTTARITLALFSLIMDNKVVAFGEEKEK
ncbi:MAG: M28 family metallopeptidase [Chitinophagales bacterium]|jgi:Zn-dependent M28 family amino/carboxypeptidase|nr:M28 family peptidase [Sphingobacteriales bacterium]